MRFMPWVCVIVSRRAHLLKSGGLLISSSAARKSQSSLTGASGTGVGCTMRPEDERGLRVRKIKSNRFRDRHTTALLRMDSAAVLASRGTARGR